MVLSAFDCYRWGCFMDAKKAILLSGVLACCLTVSSCGNNVGDTTVEGYTGLMRSETGDVLIRVQPCGLPVEVVSMAGPMPQAERPQPNPIYLQVRDSNGRPDPFTIDPRNIDPSWVAEANEELPSHRDALIIANARIEGENTQTPQVSALIKDVRALEEGEILVGNAGSSSKVINEEEFLSC